MWYTVNTESLQPRTKLEFTYSLVVIPAYKLLSSVILLPVVSFQFRFVKEFSGTGLLWPGLGSKIAGCQFRLCGGGCIAAEGKEGG